MNKAIDSTFIAPSSPVDTATLTALLNMGGPDLRADLCAQLIADFSRLRDAMGTDDGAAVARAAHEVKGLALTVGAANLASLATGLDGAALRLPRSSLGRQISTLENEIDSVLSVLGAAKRSTGRK
jgi:HPt (histidine-containing phosphotransfer) domain-containing protein